MFLPAIRIVVSLPSADGQVRTIFVRVRVVTPLLVRGTVTVFNDVATVPAFTTVGSFTSQLATSVSETFGVPSGVPLTFDGVPVAVAVLVFWPTVLVVSV